MNKTSIEWADFSVNPIRSRNRETGSVGHFCELVSPGCANCYAREFNSRVRPGKTISIGTGLDYIPQNRGKLQHYLDENVLRSVERRRKPARIFWCDMSDMFGEWVEEGWIDRCFETMAATQRHSHQILTKRPERLRAYFSGMKHLSDRLPRMCSVAPVGTGYVWPLANAWLGVSVESRDHLSRITELSHVPAETYFVSFEPLLGPLGDIKQYLGALVANVTDSSRVLAIFGGESGRGARPCEIEWIRDGMLQCRMLGVSTFVKQLGAYPVIPEVVGVSGPAVITEQNRIDREWPKGTHFGNPTEDGRLNGRVALLKDRKGGDMAEWPEDLRVREFPS